MPWIESHVEIADHPKTNLLADLLEIGIAQAVGTVHLLWYHAMKYRPEGDLKDLSDGAIARACQWAGSAKEFVAALIKAGWLEPDKKIHDWRVYAGRYLNERARWTRHKNSKMKPVENQTEVSKQTFVPTLAHARHTAPNLYPKATEELFSNLGTEKKVTAPLKQKVPPTPSLDKRDGGPNVHIRPLIDLFHTKLTTKLGEKPASFNGGAAAAGFKRLLTSYDLGLISGRFENWFRSTDRHIEKRGWRIEDFFTYFNRLKDGPVSVYVPEKEKVKSNGVPSVEATKKMLDDLWKQ